MLTIVVCMCAIYHVFISSSRMEGFGNQNEMINNMNYTELQKRILSAMLLSFNPSQHLYAQLKLGGYDMFISDLAGVEWKNELNNRIVQGMNDFLGHVLSMQHMIVLFTNTMFDGHIIFIPIPASATNMPYVIDDKVIIQKYIRWEPPTKNISLIVPKGKQLRFYFKSDHIEPKATVDGLIKEFILPDQIIRIEVDNLQVA